MRWFSKAIHRPGAEAGPETASTGTFGYPLRDAAGIAVSTVNETLDSLGAVELVHFCLFSEADLAAYRDAAGLGPVAKRGR